MGSWMGTAARVVGLPILVVHLVAVPAVVATPDVDMAWWVVRMAALLIGATAVGALTIVQYREEGEGTVTEDGWFQAMVLPTDEYELRERQLSWEIVQTGVRLRKRDYRVLKTSGWWHIYGREA